MKFVINLFLALAVGMPVYSWANPLSSQALPDLLDLYRYAQKHDPHLSVAIARKQADQEQFAQARSHLLPNLSLTADSGRVVRRLQDRAETIPVIENKFDQKMLQARLSLPLVDLQRWYGYRAGKAASARAEAEFGAALQLFHQRLVEAYVQVLNAQSKLNIRKAERAAAMRQQEKLRRQLDAGMVSRVDVEVINAEVSRLKVQFIRAQGDAEQALRVLEVLTGQTLVGVKPLKNQFEQSVADRPLGFWMDRALARNLDLVTARLTRETLDLQASAAKAAHLPTLSLNAQAQHELSGTAAGLGPNSQEFVTETGSVTLRLEVPLYSGGVQVHFGVKRRIGSPRLARTIVWCMRRSLQRWPRHFIV